MMGAFNTLQAECVCPACKKAGLFTIQFKYGHTWQLAYRIGDEVRWGGNDIGIRQATDVRVYGICEPCSHCGVDAAECSIILHNNVIVRVDGMREYDSGKRAWNYEIL